MKRYLPILFLLFCPSAHATISFVQDTSGIDYWPTTTVSATFGSDNTAGCLLIVTAGNYVLTAFAVPNLNTPTDTAGDTFLPMPVVRGENPLFEYASSWYTTNCVGGPNVVTITGAVGDFNLVVTEYAPTTPGTITIDQQHTWTCGQTTQDSTPNVIASPVVYTSVATELLYAWAFETRQVVTMSVDNSYTIREQSSDMVFAGTIVTADRNVTSRGSYSTTFSGLDYFTVSGSASFKESGSIIIPPIQQTVCGDSLQAWHEMGTFTTEDILLEAVNTGDYIFVGYHKNLLAMVSGVTNTNGYTWTQITTSNNDFMLYYAVAPMDAAAGDVLTFTNISNNNAGRVVVLHGLSVLPDLVEDTDTSAIMNLTLAGYTTPDYCTSSANDCATTSLWLGVMMDTRALLGDFIIFASAESQFATSPPAIPGTTPPPGTDGTDLFPTDRHYVGVWLPGAPANIKHAVQEY